MTNDPVAGDERGAGELAGRDEQLTAIGAALAGIAAAGTSVLLRGDPGMGKTALLKVAESTARDAGLRVLRMTGTEAESGLPFAALHQVLWPLLDDTRALSAEQRDALERALGVREGAPPEGFTVAGAALTLLAHAAAQRPVVVLLDDLQWADPSSAAVFGYLRRHLAALPVVLVAATRHAGQPRGDGRPRGEESGDAESRPGRVIDLEPLDDDQAGRLLRTLHPWLPDTAHHRVLRASGGNPLALRELPVQIRRVAPDHPALLADPVSADASADGTDPFDELPLGTRLGSLYEDGLRALPDSTRHTLLVAAVGGSFAQRVSALRDMARHGVTAPWTEIRHGIEASGLARVDPTRDLVVFHHPLVRACLVHIASPAERRAAHRLLARALPASYAAFDLLAEGGEDCRRLPYAQRRARLVRLLAPWGPPLQAVPSTTDRQLALTWYETLPETGVEGLVIKRLDSAYRGGTRAWLKLRHSDTRDAVVVGCTGNPARPQALVLALPGDGTPVVSSPLSPAVRSAAAQALPEPVGEGVATAIGIGDLTYAALPAEPVVMVEVRQNTTRHATAVVVRFR
ncbi:AAA family ATPase [Streptomyces sp. G44]|uniref:AAA family ATPase n=1 Tax=Streptomyces sp. G44 TaxID=2807632 RepID=UPI00196187F9|nr:AAA family ATPase [Streptomyces sp. G44]MBM7173649.1 AAA family ATPase [Streptomyces sp. G44]